MRNRKTSRMSELGRFSTGKYYRVQFLRTLNFLISFSLESLTMSLTYIFF